MSADTRLAADLRVSGDRSVGSAVNSVVVTGNGNVVLLVDGREFTRVAVPESAVAAAGMLFARSGPVGSPLVGSWLRPDAGVVSPQPRPEIERLVGWGRSGQGPRVRRVCGAGG